MAVERTLSIVKPDAVAKNAIGEIYTRFEKAGLKIIASRMLQDSLHRNLNYSVTMRIDKNDST